MRPCSCKFIAACNHSLTGHNPLHHLTKQVDLNLFGRRHKYDIGTLLTMFSLMGWTVDALQDQTSIGIALLTKED